MTEEDKVEQLLDEIKVLKEVLEGFISDYNCAGCKGPHPECPVSGTIYCAKILLGDKDE